VLFLFFTFGIFLLWLSGHVMSVMSRCLGRKVFQRGWREAMPLLCRFFFFLFLRHEAASLACVFAALCHVSFSFGLWFFLLFFAFVGPGMVQGQNWGYVTGWDRVQVRR
jgi:hypothetical protein